MRFRGALLVAIAAGAIVLPGCAVGGPPAPTSSTPSSTPVSPGTSPTPSPTTGPAALSCEGLLDDASVAAYADAGWTLSADFAQRMIEQDLPLRAFPETGGVLCQWGVGDASEYYGVTTLSPDRTASERDRLVAAGYVAGDHADGELLIGDITDGVREFNLFVGDEWTVAFSIDRIAEIRRNAAS